MRAGASNASARENVLSVGHASIEFVAAPFLCVLDPYG